eukprot:scaffold4543_cov126-Isochrysis_galbana.AAC.15
MGLKKIGVSATTGVLKTNSSRAKAVMAIMPMRPFVISAFLIVGESIPNGSNWSMPGMYFGSRLPMFSWVSSDLAST